MPRGQKPTNAKASVEKPPIASYDPPSQSEILKLRERWELACVINFLSVFEPVLGSDLKISAEEIEEALVKPNHSLAQLHIALLKGIPPVSKTLNASDAWVTALFKKLATWWPWVAEGEIPPTAAKGEEISRYEQLDPTVRLLILKALCEVRADQHDAVSYINDSLKHGTQISSFRKDNIGGDGNGTSYWYDGDSVIGYRLYKEVKIVSRTKAKGKECLALPSTSIQWETLATNLEEFCEISDKLSSSKILAEVSVSETIETDVIPVIEKLNKKKERALKRKQRQAMLLDGFRSSYDMGITRSCRNRRPVSYTFDEFDRVIDEAIQVTNERNCTEERGQEEKHSEHGQSKDGSSKGELNSNKASKDSSIKQGDMIDTEADCEMLPVLGNDDIEDDHYYDKSDDDYDDKKDDAADDDNGSDSGNSNDADKRGNSNHAQLYCQNQTSSFAGKPVRYSKRLAGDASQPVVQTRSSGTKNRSRQRPTPNSALDCIIVSDSENEKVSESANSRISGHDNSSEVAD